MAIASNRSGGGRDAGARRRDDVFPGLQAFIGVGVLVGLAAAIGVAGLLGRSDGRLLTLAGQGIGLGGILGLFVGLGRGAWRPGPAVAPAPAPELWDPWLDHGRDLDVSEPEVLIEEPGILIEEPARPADPPAPVPARAAVRPRVVSRQTGEAFLLEDEVGPMLQEGRGGIVVILGVPGSGKTTALRHLAAILPPWARGRVRFLEVLDLTEIASAGPDCLVILAMDSVRVASPGYEKVILGYTNPELAAFGELLKSRDPSVYLLAPWTLDDAMEYLLATDRGACASVMGRLRASRDFSFLEGIPELCTAVLDRMARHESIGDARAALGSELAAQVEGGPLRRRRLADQCLARFHVGAPAKPDPIAQPAAGDPTTGRLARLVRHRPAALLLAAERVAAIIEGGRATRALARRYARDLVLEVARTIAGDAAALRQLNDWIEGKPWTIHPLAASLLHAATPGWRPELGRRPCLEGAYLDGVAWSGQDLAGVNLRRAQLRGADLGGANLERALVREAGLQGANLKGAVLNHWNASGTDLGRADLSQAQARRAQFRKADLSGAFLVEARLWEADLTGARIEEADFTGAQLQKARLRGLPLCRARFEGARFVGADLRECDMEGMALTGPDFHDARLNQALLTGTRLPDANFLAADLRGAGLAEIDWPGACLVSADLRGASFHLGTTRSGLVDSPIACEGSRTGFYTDDDLDRHVRPAEEIRKANLRGADLRGANIEDVDFYLVDLRGARYTEAQAEHFRRCRAILDERTA